MILEGNTNVISCDQHQIGPQSLPWLKWGKSWTLAVSNSVQPKHSSTQSPGSSLWLQHCFALQHSLPRWLLGRGSTGSAPALTPSLFWEGKGSTSSHGLPVSHTQNWSQAFYWCPQSHGCQVLLMKKKEPHSSSSCHCLHFQQTSNCGSK